MTKSKKVALEHQHIDENYLHHWKNWYGIPDESKRDILARAGNCPVCQATLLKYQAGEEEPTKL